MYIYIYSVYVYVCLYTYIYIPERQWVRRLRTVSTCVLCRCSLSSWRFQKYFVFWVKMHIAWFLLDGVVCFARMCAELDGIEFVCVCLLVVFFALHNFTRVRWGGLGWGWWVRKIPPCPNGKNATHCQRVPQLEENMCKIHWLCTTILWVYTHIYIYICPRRWVRRRLNMKISNQKLCKWSCQRTFFYIFFWFETIARCHV